MLRLFKVTHVWTGLACTKYTVYSCLEVEQRLHRDVLPSSRVDGVVVTVSLFATASYFYYYNSKKLSEAAWTCTLEIFASQTIQGA